MGRYKVNNDGTLGDMISGRGKAEYGASTIRKGTIEIPKYEDGDNIGKELTVTFDTPMPDSDYLLDINSFSAYNIYTLAVRNKTANGFTLLVRLSFAQSTTITGTANPRNLYYTAFKLYTDTEYNGLLNNQIYSTSEINTGKKWIDGKDIYRKVVDCGALPNATTKNVAHGITGYDNIVSIGGFARIADGSTQIPLPYVSPTGYNITIDVRGANVIIGTDYDRTSYTKAYIILEYTKTA